MPSSGSPDPFPLLDFVQWTRLTARARHGPPSCRTVVLSVLRLCDTIAGGCHIRPNRLGCMVLRRVATSIIEHTRVDALGPDQTSISAPPPKWESCLLLSCWLVRRNEPSPLTRRGPLQTNRLHVRAVRWPGLNSSFSLYNERQWNFRHPRLPTGEDYHSIPCPWGSMLARSLRLSRSCFREPVCGYFKTIPSPHMLSRKNLPRLVGWTRG